MANPPDARFPNPGIDWRRMGVVVALLVIGLATTSATRVGGVGKALAADGPVVITGRWVPTVLPPGTENNESLRNNYIDSAHPLIEPAGRKLFMISDTWLAGYDFDTMQARGSGLALTGSITGNYIDPVSGTLFAAFTEQTAGGRVWLDQYASLADGIKRVSTLDLTATIPGNQVSAIYRLPGSNVMWLLAQPAGRDLSGYQVAGGVTLVELRLGAPGTAPVVQWTLLMNDCFSPMHKSRFVETGIGYVADRGAVYFGCASGRPLEVGPVQQIPVRRGIAKVRLRGDPTAGPTPPPSAADFVMFSRDGNYLDSDSFFHPGSNRVVFSATSQQGTSVYAFDADTETYVGGVSVGGNKIKQPGFDAVHGRFYAGSPAYNIGLVVSDIETTPLSQGVSLPEFAGSATQPIADGPMGVDPVTHRLMLKYELDHTFVLAQDRMPPYVVPSPPNPDAATLDVDEVPGRTRASFSASTQGYGARFRQIGGTGALVTNISQITVNQLGIGPGTREIRSAYLNLLRLGNSEASASAITVDSDRANTQGDLTKTTPPGGSQAVTWPYHEAACFDFGGSATDVDRDGSRAVCDASNRHVEGKSDAQPVSVNAVTIQGGSVNSVARLDPVRGVVAKVTSTAKGIDVLGGLLHIGYVEATAEAMAKGRPGTASGKRPDPKVDNVTMSGAPICTTDCDLNELARTVNERLAGRVRIDFPKPDTGLLASKGGYQALVRINPADHLEQVILNEQPSERIEVPSMVITVYQDTTLPARTIVNLAAVEAEARYGISTTGGLILDDGDQISGPGPLFGLTDAVGLGGSLTPGGGSSGSPSVPAAIGVDDLGPASSGNPAETAGRLIWNGLRGALRLFPIWAVLLAPIYLSARRWLLFRRSSLVTGGT